MSIWAGGTPAVGAGLALLPLSPVWILTYALVIGLIYFVLAVAFDLPLPGAGGRRSLDDLPAPRYTGRLPKRKPGHRR